MAALLKIALLASVLLLGATDVLAKSKPKPTKHHAKPPTKDSKDRDKQFFAIFGGEL